MFGNKTGLGILFAAMLAAVVAPAAARAAAQSSATSTVGLNRTSTGSFSLDVDGADLRIVKLNYANANELTQPLSATLSKRGSIQVERRTNSLIITDLPSNLDAVTQMAAQLDSQTPQIEITAKLVDVDETAIQSIGIKW